MLAQSMNVSFCDELMKLLGIENGAARESSGKSGIAVAVLVRTCCGFAQS